jgi:hypothetical protein
MKRAVYATIIIIGMLLIYYILFKPILYTSLEVPTEILSDSSSFNLKPGDILIRANWDWLPGSSMIPEGHKLGHAAIVTEGSTGSSISEALSKAKVVEAVFFDQTTREYLLFKKENQVRETMAIVSFGNRFKGARYRLRMNLSEVQVEKMALFLRNQDGCSYNLISFKKKLPQQSRCVMIEQLGTTGWHCATLVWEAFYLTLGIDIDENKGIIVYPSDIVACKSFDQPGGRILF